MKPVLEHVLEQVMLFGFNINGLVVASTSSSLQPGRWERFLLASKVPVKQVR